MAPTIINNVPRIHPLSFKTTGSDKTPAPIATAHKANILPLTLPYSILPNVLFANPLRVPPKGLKSALAP